MEVDLRTQVVAGAAAMALCFGMAWFWQRKHRNAGIVDVLWSLAIGALGVTWSLLGSGWQPRRILVGTIVGLWSLRLGVHLARRVSRESEDGRYARLRDSLGERFDRWMIGFFAAQALSTLLLSLPMLLLAQASLEGWRAVDLAAALLFLLSWSGESLADRQLARWREDPAHRGQTCRSGLWAWSRHPNYFFEWLHWLVYPVLGWGLEGGWVLWLAPAVMLYLVLKVTGIPPTEEQSLRSRGDDYRRYQATTSAFFPLPPRTSSSTQLDS